MAPKRAALTNRKPFDQTTREYVALTEASERFHTYHRMFLWSLAGLAYSAFCGIASAHLGPFRVVNGDSLVLLTEPGYSLLGGLSLLMAPLLFFGRLSAKRDLKNAADAWKRTDP
jgi:hypothetical protein